MRDRAGRAVSPPPRCSADAPRTTCEQDLEPLAQCTRLQRLDLSGNAVAKKPQYRLYLIARCPSLKLLDFARVRDAERAAAAAAFGGAAGAAAPAAPPNAAAAAARSASRTRAKSSSFSDGQRAMTYSRY